MTIYEVRCAAEDAGVQLDDPAPLHPDTMSEVGDDRNGGHVEQSWDL